MKKIPTALVRDETDRRFVTEAITPGCEWVFDGSVVPTRKYDGTCTMLDERGLWWARREVSMDKPYPSEWVSEQFDPVTRKAVGWMPIETSSFYKFFLEADHNLHAPGTFELCGPKINGNPERLERHTLFRHDNAQPIFIRIRTPRDAMDAVRAVAGLGYEGLVWHGENDLYAKLKVKDVRPVPQDCWPSVDR